MRQVLSASQHNIWMRGPAAEDSSDFLPTRDQLTAWDDRMRALTTQQGAGSLGEALEADGRPLTDSDRRLYRGVQLWFGQPAEELMLIEWQGEHGDYPGPHAVLRGGTHSLAERMRAEIESRAQLELNQPVVRMEESSGHVLAHTADGQQWLAPWLVLTVSLGVLKAAAPDFISPALPEPVNRSIDELAMCCYTKLIVALEPAAAARLPVWLSLEHGLFWQAFNYWPIKRVPVVVLCSVLPEAEQLAPAECRQIAREMLRARCRPSDDCDLVGSDQEVLETRLTNWSQDQWARGAYSTFTRTAGWDAIDRFVSGMAGRRIGG